MSQETLSNNIIINENYNNNTSSNIILDEVNFDKFDKIRCLDITMVTSSKNKEGTFELLKQFNFPLNEKKN